MPSINTNISSLAAQAGLRASENQAKLAIQRLSTGNRIVQASDDAAGLAVGTVLATALGTQKQLLTNTTQGTSILNIADGALQSISEVLQRQKSLATQANNAALSDSQRALLDVEFQQLIQEIDRLATGTEFNGVQLLDGNSFKGVKSVIDNTKTTATGSNTATLIIDASGEFTNNETIVINGFTITARDTVADATTQIQTSANTATLQSNLLTFLQNSTDPRLAAATYSEAAGTFTITLKPDVSAVEASTFGVGIGTSAATGTASTIGRLTYSGVGAAAPVATGLNKASYSFTGATGDTVLVTTAPNSTAQVRAVGISEALAVADIAVGETIIVGGANGTTFTIIDKGTALNSARNELVVDLDTDDSGAVDGDDEVNSRIAALVSALNASEHPDLAGITFIKTAGASTITATYDVATESATVNSLDMTISGQNLNLGTGGNNTAGNANGLDVSKLANNKDFIGTVTGFSATYVSANKVTLSLEVGDYTYVGTVEDTNPAAITTVAFAATDRAGGRFDVQLEAGQGSIVNNQTDATAYAKRFDNAFGALTFQQRREVTNYNGSGAVVVNNLQTAILDGSRIFYQTDSDADFVIEDVKVNAPTGNATNGTLEFVANGETYRSAAITNSSIDVGAVITLTNVNNADKTITLEAGGGKALNITRAANAVGTAMSFLTAERASGLESKLKSALGIGLSGNALKFQVGNSSTQTIDVSIRSAKTADLYNGATLDIKTSATSITAATAIDAAIDTVSNIRAGIGALQSRFTQANNVLEVSIQNTDATRSKFLDTDIAEESTNFATFQVKSQAAISVLAQANQIQQNLLKLIS